MRAVGCVVDGGDWLDQEIEMARGPQRAHSEAVTSQMLKTIKSLIMSILRA
jgi:hypothetical protein